MPRHTITDDKGRPIDLEWKDGEAPPSEQELEQLFAAKYPSKSPSGKEGVLAGDSPYKDIQEATPWHGAINEAKEGYERGEQLLGNNIAGKAAGAVMGGARALMTGANPLGKIIGAIPKYAQAVGSAAGGDLRTAGQDITGSREVLPDLKTHYYETGIPAVDVPLNTVSGIAKEVQKNPTLLAAALAPEEQVNAVRNVASDIKNSFSADSRAAVADALKNKASQISDAISEKRNGTMEQHGEKYRELLAPTAGEIKKVEIKGGKNIQDSYDLAAEEGLPINKTADNKLDTSKAREQLQGKIDPLEERISSEIAAAPQKQFNVRELADEMKAQMRDRFKDDEQYESALEAVDRKADAIIRQRGENISGAELNDIKRGAWDQGYDALAPNAHKIARVVGNVAKEAIEQAYSDSDIRGLNAQLGKYLTLKELLENAQGRVINGGKIGKHKAEMIGSVAGAMSHIPVVGPYIVSKLAGAVHNYLTDPARITSGIARKVQRLQANDPQPAPQPSSADVLEAKAQSAAERAQMQRKADAIKAEELARQSKEVTPQGEEMEDSLKQLSKQSQMRRLADTIKSQELDRQNQELRGQLMTKDMLPNPEAPKAEGNPIKIQDVIESLIQKNHQAEREALIRKYLDEMGLE